MRCVIWTISVLLLASVSLAGPFSEFLISPSEFTQQNPDVDGTIVVWQEDFSENSTPQWDILGLDINQGVGSEFIFGPIEYNDTNPAVSGDNVVWQQEYLPTDYDIYMGNITTNSQVPVSTYIDYNEQNPAIHGNFVVWQERLQDESETGDWDIYSADMLNPADPNVQPVCYFTEDQVTPAVYRADVVFADFFVEEATGSFDITVTDTWLRNNPTFSYPVYQADDEVAPAIDGDYIVYQHDYSGNQTDYDVYVIDRSDSRVNVISAVSTLNSSEEEPDISGDIVVWQDNRNGDWDIYGYNLVTRQEFRITNDAADQMYPAISILPSADDQSQKEYLVVWQDERGEMSQIYGAFLTGDVVAFCDMPIAGDVDGNCRVDLADLSELAQNWLTCDLIPSSACGE